MLHNEHKREPGQLVFLNPVDGISLGGGEMVAVEILSSLAEKGWKIVLMTPKGSGVVQHLRHFENIEIVPVDLTALTPGSLTTVIKFSRCYNDAVWYGNTYRSLKWLAVARIAGDVRTFCHLHESAYEPYYFCRTRWLSGLIDGFICISETVRREIIQGTRRSTLPASIIYNGLTPGPVAHEKSDSEKQRLREELGLPTGKRLVCMAGRSDPLKGHEVFLRMAARILKQKSDIHFVIVGGAWGTAKSGAYERRIQDLLLQLGIGAAFTLQPYTPRARDFMRCADIVVVPSLAEGFGRVAVEAMMEQTVVVASKVGGLAEIIRDEIDGLLVPPGDDGQLSGAVLRLLLDGTLCERLRQAAWKRSMEKFSNAAMMDQIEQLLHIRS